jgi:hypothetical protein
VAGSYFNSPALCFQGSTSASKVCFAESLRGSQIALWQNQKGIFRHKADSGARGIRDLKKSAYTRDKEQGYCDLLFQSALQPFSTLLLSDWQKASL